MWSSFQAGKQKVAHFFIHPNVNWGFNRKTTMLIENAPACFGDHFVGPKACLLSSEAWLSYTLKGHQEFLLL